MEKYFGKLYTNTTVQVPFAVGKTFERFFLLFIYQKYSKTVL